MFKNIRALVRDESGATAVEYALIVALVSIAATGAYQLVGNNLSMLFDTVATKL